MTLVVQKSYKDLRESLKLPNGYELEIVFKKVFDSLYLYMFLYDQNGQVLDHYPPELLLDNGEFVFSGYTIKLAS